jgi:predicted nucleotidyltransferase
MIAEVETILQEMTRRLVAEFQPCQIYLFGSYAWGKPNEDSDIDLLVIVPDSKASRRDREVRARYCLRDLPIAKDVLVQTQTELERTSHVYASLQCEILERGKKLYG